MKFKILKILFKFWSTTPAAHGVPRLVLELEEKL